MSHLINIPRSSSSPFPGTDPFDGSRDRLTLMGLFLTSDRNEWGIVMDNHLSDYV